MTAAASPAVRGRSRHTVLALLGAGMLAGCASAPPHPAALEAAPEWRLEGRLALASDDDGGSGQLEWIHGAERDSLRFHGALGRGSWRLLREPTGATLTTADGRVIRAPDVEALVRDELGWDLPVTGLGSWVTGAIPPGARPAAVVRDDAGRLRRLEQGGWTIRYEAYATVDGRELPRKVEATREEDSVRLIVKRWTFDAGG